MVDSSPEIYDSIIFDLDGTLWDASETCMMVWNEALKKLGNGNHTLTRETVQSFSGLKIDKIMEREFPFMPAKEHERLLNLYERYERQMVAIHGGELYPGIKDVLQQLTATYKVFIVSNCLKGYIENFLDFNGFHRFFIDFECSGNTGLPKSENIRLIIDRNDLKHPVYVGDTIWDKEAANISHVPFIYAAYGFGKFANVGKFIESPEELLQLLPS